MKSFAILALSSLALASPHGKRHPHVPFGTGPRDGNVPKPTGGFFPGGPGNGTFPGANSTGAGSSGWQNVPVPTQPSLPVPDSSAPTGKPQGGQSGFDKPDTSGNNVADLVAGNGAGNDGTCAKVTETETVVQYVTVTGDGSGKPSGNPGTPEIPSGDEKDSVSLTDVAKPSAGEFYGRPTGGFGGQYGSPSQGGAGAVPTQATGGYGSPSQTGSGSTPVVSSPSTGGSGSGSGNSTGGGAPSGGKLGVSYNDASLVAAFQGAATWAYNWAAQPGGQLPSDIEYVAMCWGRKDESTCAQNAAGSKYVLGPNEPDHVEQANMSPEDAAKFHINVLNPLAEQGHLIGSPSITNGPPPMGTAWLQNFFDACAGQCKIDYTTFHWYDSANNFAALQSHVEDVIGVSSQNGVGSVWLTEFGVTGGDEASFISQATEYLDSVSAVARYAYFMASEGKLVNGGALSALGKAYVGGA